MKRKFYFIKDSVTGNFYLGHKNLSNLVDFDGAAIYHNEDNAKKMLKQIITNWKWTESSVDVWIADKNSVEYGKTMKRMVNQRKDLPNWGIEIVSGEVDVS
jgi:hypothetical protein